MKPWFAVGALALAGCVNMSGLDGDSKYACAAPGGVACDSVSGTYANALHHNLPSQSGAAAPASRAGSTSGPELASPAEQSAPQRPGSAVAIASPAAGPASVGGFGTALRSPARVLRLWTKPWEDADGDLWDQGYVYVQVDGGRWQLDHVQQRIRDRYLPLHPPPAGPPGAGPAPAGPVAPADFPEEAVPRSPSTTPLGSFPAFNRPPVVSGQRQP